MLELKSFTSVVFVSFGLSNVFTMLATLETQSHYSSIGSPSPWHILLWCPMPACSHNRTINLSSTQQLSSLKISFMLHSLKIFLLVYRTNRTFIGYLSTENESKSGHGLQRTCQCGPWPILQKNEKPPSSRRRSPQPKRSFIRRFVVLNSHYVECLPS